MDEVFGGDNLVSMITVAKTSSQTAELLANVSDYILWYARNTQAIKYRQSYLGKAVGGLGASGYSKLELPSGERRPLSSAEKRDLSSVQNSSRIYTTGDFTSQKPPASISKRLCRQSLM
jgi:adenine-specific DNA-methyltransferase